MYYLLLTDEDRPTGIKKKWGRLEKVLRAFFLNTTLVELLGEGGEHSIAL